MDECALKGLPALYSVSAWPTFRESGSQKAQSRNAFEKWPCAIIFASSTSAADRAVQPAEGKAVTNDDEACTRRQMEAPKERHSMRTKAATG